MTDAEIADALYAIFKGGAAARRAHTSTPYAAAERLKSMLHSFGWVQEDLRLALMKHDPNYRTGQVAFDMAEAEKGQT